MSTSRPKTEWDRRMEIVRRRTSSKAKLRRVFATVVSKLDILVETNQDVQQKELRSAKAAVEKIARRIEADGQPTVNVSEFMDLRAPDYGPVVNALHELEAKTLLQFCSTPMAQIKVRFRERGIDFPVQLELIHTEYRNQE